MTENYSVLMSVYIKEKPEYLKEAITSILNQTVKTNDFVIVCDGPLTEGLNKVIADFVTTYSGSMFTGLSITWGWQRHLTMEYYNVKMR